MRNNSGTAWWVWILVIALVFYIGLRGLGLYMDYGLRGGSGTVMTISPDKKIKVIVKVPFSPDPLPEFYYRSTGWFRSSLEKIKPHFFNYGYDVFSVNDYVWDQGSGVLYAWKDDMPVYAYDFNNPNRRFTVLDAYYAKFPFDRFKPVSEFIDYLTRQHPSYVNSFLLSSVTGEMFPATKISP